ncbi:hypothetical protein EYF80_001459 [Liparis tanakae]|uniref:Uncharacterized protein n=1 Tax=Liparis tanakae TaxID=230148 RepID=A0A4Z2JEN4_9TELE|nr:hypothetical protein EYF80_001459 [Liparis tanakae]
MSSRKNSQSKVSGSSAGAFLRDVLLSGWPNWNLEDWNRHRAKGNMWRSTSWEAGRTRSLLLKPRKLELLESAESMFGSKPVPGAWVVIVVVLVVVGREVVLAPGSGVVGAMLAALLMISPSCSRNHRPVERGDSATFLVNTRQTGHCSSHHELKLSGGLGLSCVGFNKFLQAVGAATAEVCNGVQGGGGGFGGVGPEAGSASVGSGICGTVRRCSYAGSSAGKAVGSAVRRETQQQLLGWCSQSPPCVAPIALMDKPPLPIPVRGFLVVTVVRGEGGPVPALLYARTATWYRVLGLRPDTLAVASRPAVRTRSAAASRSCCRQYRI